MIEELAKRLGVADHAGFGLTERQHIDRLLSNYGIGYEEMKQENGDPLRSRDFFAAAAYTQLLNLSMQPGWSLDITLALPQGYSFTYFNDQVERGGERKATLHVDASTSDEEVGKVFLASITHRRLVALVLFGAMWAVALVAAFPVRLVYGRQRILRIGKAGR